MIKGFTMDDQLTKSIKQETISYSKTGSNLKLSIPNAITLLRLFALPHLIWSFNHEITFAAYSIFLFSIGSDLADGYVSRKIGANSKFGANLDAAVDFVFINGMYLTFVLKGIYSAGILLLIVFMFAQFTLINGHFRKTIYDPIGKYYGSLLFGGIGLTLLFPAQIMYLLVTVGIIVSTVAAILSRLAFSAEAKFDLCVLIWSFYVFVGKIDYCQTPD
jgi:phosphatidylglycerophosphate synthase